MHVVPRDAGLIRHASIACLSILEERAGSVALPEVFPYPD